MAWWEILLLVIGILVVIGGVLWLALFAGVLTGLSKIVGGLVRDTRRDDERGRR